jgi:hypothetical protein
MTEQQKHLKSVIEQQEQLYKEIKELNNQLSIKKEISIKLQGIYEYLTGIGVSIENISEDLDSEEKADQEN